MNDPHVEWLLYIVKHGTGVDYTEAEPLTHETAAFRVRVADGETRFVMKDHRATEAEARALVDPFVRTWVFDTTLERGPAAFGLQFVQSRIVDRRPTPDPPGVVSASAEPVFFTLSTSAASGVVLCRSYPAPPETTLRVTPDVDSMHQRYLGYRAGKEPLPSMAYFCLTVLVHPSGEPSLSVAEAARRYGISRNVLGTIRRLSSSKGGPIARKADGLRDELTPEEVRFLECAIPKVIRRAAQVAHDPATACDPVRTSDLPRI